MRYNRAVNYGLLIWLQAINHYTDFKIHKPPEKIKKVEVIIIWAETGYITKIVLEKNQ